MDFFNDTTLLIKAIGLPGLVEGEPLRYNEALNLFWLAALNKIPLLYLESIKKQRNHSFLKAQLLKYRNKYSKTLNLTAQVSSLLEESGIHYTVFKTLKPFPYTPADIDMLLLSSGELGKVSNILKKSDFITLERDLYGVSMYSYKHDLIIDLTTEVAVSGFIYLDKSLLSKYIYQVNVDRIKVQALYPHAELVIVATHCMYKEQMYTLSDYYTFTLFSQYYQEALKLTESVHAKLALEVALKITYDITVNVFGSNNILVKKIESLFRGTGMFERVSSTKKNLELPMKYSPSLLMRGLLEKILEDSISRGSLPLALNSAFRTRFFTKLLNHILRKSY